MLHTATETTKVGDTIEVGIPCRVVGVGTETRDEAGKPTKLVFSCIPTQPPATLVAHLVLTPPSEKASEEGQLTLPEGGA